MIISTLAIISSGAVCLEDPSRFHGKPAPNFAEKMMQSFFFSKLPPSDTSPPRPFSAQPRLISPSLPLCPRPCVPTSFFLFYRALDLPLEPEGLLSNSSVLQSPSVSRPLWLLFFLSLSPLAPALRHHPGALIYKLAAKAWLIPSSSSSSSSGEIVAERQEGEGRAIGEDMICQPKEDDTKNLNVSGLLALICLPAPGAEGEARLSLSISDRERPEGAPIRSE